MKTLTLKTGAVPKGGDDLLTYEGLVRACLDKPPAQGFTRQDLRKRDRIEKVLDAANGELELEDADAAVLKQIVDSMRWGLRHSFVLEFCDDVAAL